MPKIATKYYKRAKAHTNFFINSVESDQDFTQHLSINNEINTNEQLNCIELDHNNFNNIEFDNNILESFNSDSDLIIMI